MQNFGAKNATARGAPRNPCRVKRFKRKKFCNTKFFPWHDCGAFGGLSTCQASCKVMEMNCCEVLKLASTFEHIKHTINNRKCELPFQSSETFFVSTSFNEHKSTSKIFASLVMDIFRNIGNNTFGYGGTTAKRSKYQETLQLMICSFTNC